MPVVALTIHHLRDLKLMLQDNKSQQTKFKRKEVTAVLIKGLILINFLSLRYLQVFKARHQRAI